MRMLPTPAAPSKSAANSFAPDRAEAEYIARLMGKFPELFAPAVEVIVAPCLPQLHNELHRQPPEGDEVW